MKNFIGKYGVTFGLSALLVLIFVFGGIYSRYMTKQIDVHAYESYLEMFSTATDIEVFETEAVELSYLKPGKTGQNDDDYFTPVLNASYKVYEDDEEIGVVYVVISHGNAENMMLAFAISEATDSIVGVEVISHGETNSPQYFGKLDATFYSQFDDKPFDDIDFSVDAVAGATNSSKGFEIGMDFAREQYAHDFGFEIPSVIITLNSLDYNFDPATFVDYPFVADVTYGETSTNIVCYLTSDFSYGDLVSGSEAPDANTQAAIKAIAGKSTAVSSSSYFVSYDETTRTLVMETKGYVATPIRVTIVVNSTLNGIESYTVVSSESYADEYNDEYTGGQAPAVENNLMDQYLAGSVEVDAVAGASLKTSPAMQSLIRLLDQFIDQLNGGA
ncbi:MAG: FMN-binding protein [Bacilli bacterium]|nr:FMN-binding protein [Bacilli bacterium]